MTPAETALTPQQIESIRTLRLEFSRMLMHHRFVVNEVLTKPSILREESIYARSLLVKVHRRGLPLDGDVPDRLIDELTEAADASDQLDRRMEQLHSEVREGTADIDSGEEFDEEALRILWDLSRQEG